MPRLSIVLVTYREQGFLRRSLSSRSGLLDQLDGLGDRSADVEVLVVDDASPDHTAEILADLAAADSRLRVQRNETRLGAGAARAAALDLVTGDHVWFVEPTDLLPDGAVAAVLDALAAPGDPPRVLVVDHAVRAYDASLRTVPAPPGGTPHLWDTVVATALLRAERRRAHRRCVGGAHRLAGRDRRGCRRPAGRGRLRAACAPRGRTSPQ